MALPLPDLDDRRWDDLVEEGRSLIPFYAPEWTDHNAHDPGITLLELFAWLAEMELFELNQISGRQRRKLLALAGVTSKPAAPARALLTLEPAGAAPVSIEAGLEFSGLDPFGAEVRFRALHGLDTLPGSIAALQTANGDVARNLTGSWKRGEALRPFGDNPAPGSTVMIGIAPVAPWPAGSVVSLGFVIDGDDEGDDIHHGVRLAWEVRTTGGSWIACDPRDETRSLSRSGRVEITVPISPSATIAGSVAWPLIWFRARIARGRHDAAPVLRSIAFNAVSIEQSVPNVTWLRIKEGATVPATPAPIGSLIDPDFDLDRSGAITRFAFTSPVPDRPPVRLLAWDFSEKRVALEVAAAATGDGSPSFVLETHGDRLIESTVSVVSFEPTGVRDWTRVPDFDASRRSDAHVVVDPETGRIVFGDGEHGRALPDQAPAIATGYSTRGGGGNIAAGAVTAIADSAHNRAMFGALVSSNPFSRITNPSPAWGGEDAEPLRTTIARARREREAPARAVTLEDHAALALATPGARLARAEARANLHPGFPCLVAPGIVTVLILPWLPESRPEPTDGLRRLVAEWLNSHRLLGSRIEVVGPVYVPVTVRADIGIEDGAIGADVIESVRERVDRFLDPLAGGPDGTGWPFGRDIYRSELLQTIDETPGVSFVRRLEIVDGAGHASCGNLCIGPLGLPDGQAHEIRLADRRER